MIKYIQGLDDKVFLKFIKRVIGSTNLPVDECEKSANSGSIRFEWRGKVGNTHRFLIIDFSDFDCKMRSHRGSFDLSVFWRAILLHYLNPAEQKKYKEEYNKSIDTDLKSLKWKRDNDIKTIHYEYNEMAKKLNSKKYSPEEIEIVAEPYTID